MMEPQRTDVTELLHRWRGGDQDALDRLLPLVYDELRKLASKYMRAERPDHTLQATALVHEAYVRLAGSDIDWKDRAHFMALSARMMRRILVDHAKAGRRHKRGAGAVKVSLDEVVHVGTEPAPELIELDRALDKLAEVDERKARAVELHFFGGLTYDETAEALGVSPATVARELRMARAWLYNQLGAETAETDA